MQDYTIKDQVTNQQPQHTQQNNQATVNNKDQQAQTIAAEQQLPQTGLFDHTPAIALSFSLAVLLFAIFLKVGLKIRGED